MLKKTIGLWFYAFCLKLNPVEWNSALDKKEKTDQRI